VIGVLAETAVASVTLLADATVASVPFLAETTVGGVRVVTLAAFVLLVAGVGISVSPVPAGGLVSLLGVYLYWWGSGYTAPSTLLLVVLTVIGLLTLVAAVLGDVVAARVGGASNRTAAIASVVGFVLFFVAGPVGILVGITVTVFVLEFLRGQGKKQSAVAALSVLAGSLASNVVQVLLTGSILVVMLLVAL